MKNLVFACLLVTVCNGDIPHDFMRCHKDDRNCLSNAIKDALQKLTKPYPEVGLPSLDPLEIDDLIIKSKESVHLVHHFQNVQIYGFTKPIFVTSSMDINRFSGLLAADFPVLEVGGDYTIDGSVMDVPLHGEGNGKIIIGDLKTVMSAVFDKYVKDGETHLRVANATVLFLPGTMEFKLNKVIAGETLDRTRVNKVLTDNWREIFNDVHESYENSFQRVAVDLLNNFLAKVKMADIFTP